MEQPTSLLQRRTWLLLPMCLLQVHETKASKQAADGITKDVNHCQNWWGPMDTACLLPPLQSGTSQATHTAAQTRFDKQPRHLD